ncbi:MAG: hypothetical protein ACRDLB_12690 [Actinomycetota bacterium]
MKRRNAPDRVFEFDPLLGSASLRMKIDGTVHSVEWRATSEPPFTTGLPGCTDPVPYGRGWGRDMAASGSVLNRELDNSALEDILGAYLETIYIVDSC